MADRPRRNPRGGASRTGVRSNASARVQPLVQLARSENGVTAMWRTQASTCKLPRSALGPRTTKPAASWRLTRRRAVPPRGAGLPCRAGSWAAPATRTRQLLAGYTATQVQYSTAAAQRDLPAATCRLRLVQAVTPRLHWLRRRQQLVGKLKAAGPRPRQPPCPSYGTDQARVLISWRAWPPASRQQTQAHAYRTGWTQA